MMGMLKNKKILGVIAIAVIIVVMALFSGGRSYEDVVDDYCNGMLNADAKKVVSTFSDGLLQEKLRQSGCRNREELTEMLQDNLNFIQERFGDKWYPSYQIIQANEYDEKVEVAVRITDYGGMIAGDTVRAIILRKIDGEWYIDKEYKLR